MDGMMSALGEELGRLAGLSDAPGTIKTDGIERCSVCGEARSKKIIWQGREMTVSCLCDCQMREVMRKREQEEERERIRRIERVRNLSMMPGKYAQATFESYRQRPENKKALDVSLKYASHFREMEKENQGILFHGPVGTGKSYTAACIANYLMDREVSVVMTSIARVLENDWDEVQGAVRNARLLILDDLGAERETDFALERVYGLIDARVRSGRPMIVTTNTSVREMLGCQDIRKRRTYDRVLEVCYPVEVTGRSMRIDIAARRQADMRKLLGGGA